MTPNPLTLSTALLECSGGGSVPMIKILFRNTADMYAAADYLRQFIAARESSEGPKNGE